jgi:hypothetical protein
VSHTIPTPRAKRNWRAHFRTLLPKHLSGTGGPISIRSLLDGSYVKQKHAETQAQLIFSADDLLSEEVASAEELQEKLSAVVRKFTAARDAAIQNTRFYLSMVHDLDVYVATSMRTRNDFRSMADACEAIFSDARLKDLELRYFDATLSAAAGHEDKGLIECLMVKCYKVLVHSELLHRMFENDMQYELEQPKAGYFRLKEKLTGSVVRVQTNFPPLRETFWNYYNEPSDED